MARKNAVASAPPAPKKDAYPKVIDHYGDPSWKIGRLGNQPSIYNGIVSVDRYQIRVEKIDEPEDVIVARLKRLWRATERNHHHWHPVRSFLMRRFGWDHDRTIREFPSEDNGIEHIPGAR